MAPKGQYNHEYYKKHRERILAKNYAYEKRRLANDPEFLEAKRESSRRSQKKRREQHREIRHAALDKPCVDCGIELPPEVMEFDHVRGRKKFVLCQSYGGSFYVSYEMLHEEIAKCDVRCPNCHRMRHYLERLERKNGEASDDHPSEGSTA